MQHKTSVVVWHQRDVILSLGFPWSIPLGGSGWKPACSVWGMGLVLHSVNPSNPQRYCDAGVRIGRGTAQRRRSLSPSLQTGCIHLPSDISEQSMEHSTYAVHQRLQRCRWQITDTQELTAICTAPADNLLKLVKVLFTSFCPSD